MYLQKNVQREYTQNAIYGYNITMMVIIQLRRNEAAARVSATAVDCIRPDRWVGEGMGRRGMVYYRAFCDGSQTDKGEQEEGKKNEKTINNEKRFAKCIFFYEK